MTKRNPLSFIVLFIIVLGVNADAQAQTPLTNLYNAEGFENCISCELSQKLSVFVDEFARRGAVLLSAGIVPLAKTIFILTLLILGIRTIIYREPVKWLPRVMLTATVVSFFLWSPLLVFEFFLWPMQKFVLDVSIAFVREFSPVRMQPPAGLVPYAELMWYVEYMASWVILLSIKIITSSWLPWDLVLRLIGGFLLMAPWFFIIVIQALYLTEAAFMFALAGIISPVLLAAYIAPMGRSYLPAMLRILLGSSLTVVFAAIVISFTGAVVQDSQQKVLNLLDPSGSTAVVAAEHAVKDLCRSKKDQTFDPVKCTQAQEQLNLEKEPKFSVFDAYFFWLLLTGVISVLLHMKARTWASNLSGAQDGGSSATLAGIVTGAAGIAYAGATKLIGGGGAVGGKISSHLPNPFNGGGGSSSPGGSTPSVLGSDPNGLRSGDVIHSVITPSPMNDSSSGLNLGDIGKGTAEVTKDTAASASGASETRKGGLRE